MASGGDANIRVEGVDGESYIEFANTFTIFQDQQVYLGRCRIGLNDNLNLYFGVWAPNYTLNKTNGSARELNQPF